MKTLRKYLNSLSRTEQTEFAVACGTTLGYLRKAISVNQRLGLELCVVLEKKSFGSVYCEELRPDVDWAFLRNTAPPIPNTTHQETA